jgi:hypothetical protein
MCHQIATSITQSQIQVSLHTRKGTVYSAQLPVPGLVKQVIDTRNGLGDALQRFSYGPFLAFL